MSFVITQSCCSDTSCLPVCPVSCIRPRPEDPDFLTAEMLYIDPGTCIDCGACTEVCPVGAIQHEDDLSEDFVRYADINAAYFERNPLIGDQDQVPAPVPAPTTAKVERPDRPWRVAIVGSGPSGIFAAAELFAQLGKGAVEIEMFDRLPTPWGLARAGVAPDHWGTKEISELFRRIAAKPGFRFHLNVEIGRHLTHEELAAHHDAVIYATGALGDRSLGIEGEDLPGCVAATEFVAWYNGHPDFADRAYDLSGERAVVVGNGNVALDVARILVTDPDQLATTDIADNALEALRRSRIREVVVLGRRGAGQAAYTTPELLALGSLAGVDVVVEGADFSEPDAASSFVGELKRRVLAELAERSTSSETDRKRIVLRFLASPTRLLGTERVERIELAHNEIVRQADGAAIARPTGEVSELAASLVVRSVGFRATVLPGLPFDDRAGRFPHQAGRMIDPDAGKTVTGVYTTGWAKRGASGVIGTNRLCAKETVEAVIDDLRAGVLNAPHGDAAALAELVAQRQPDALDRASWLVIEKAERAAGRAQRRPRVKLTDVSEMVRVARG